MGTKRAAIVIGADVMQWTRMAVQWAATTARNAPGNINNERKSCQRERETEEKKRIKNWVKKEEEEEKETERGRKKKKRKKVGPGH